MGTADRVAAAKLLRGETAQTLGFVLVRLSVLAQLNVLDVLHEELAQLRETVRLELEHVLQLAKGLEQEEALPAPMPATPVR
jgi:hypothetical protein